MNINDRLTQNNNYYDLFFENVKDRTEKRDYSYLIKRFIDDLPQNGIILDIGCGTGEHLKEFTLLGFNTLGIEPSLKSRTYCLKQGLNVIDGSFETLNRDVEFINDHIVGVWCAASLLHVPKNEFVEVTKNIYKILVKGGKLFLTLRIGNSSKWDSYDSNHTNAQRFIQLYEENFITESMDNIGFTTTLKMIEDSYWGRPTKWISMIMKK